MVQSRSSAQTIEIIGATRASLRACESVISRLVRAARLARYQLTKALTVSRSVRVERAGRGRVLIPSFQEPGFDLFRIAVRSRSEMSELRDLRLPGFRRGLASPRGDDWGGLVSRDRVRPFFSDK